MKTTRTYARPWTALGAASLIMACANIDDAAGTIAGGAGGAAGEPEAKATGGARSEANATGGSEANATGGSEANATGGVPVTSQENESVTEDDPFLAYCDTEARCIPWCLCDAPHGMCECSSEQRAWECAADVLDWGPRKQGPTCEAGLQAWVRCINGLATCEEVHEFFHAHPDDVTESTPCGPEFFAMNDVCNDFEPPTEYSFNPPTEGAAAEPEPSVSVAYCEMEARCIPLCLYEEGSVDCASEERRAQCAVDVETWGPRQQDETCQGRMEAWMTCISAASCDEVREFFQAEPDGVTESTPCGPEVTALKKVCDEFEPLTEYGFEG